ncbi:helix-turn-helix domain-containing protein [Hymenobacter cheonanensis]|uniref:helix-turn-helix domain-containing protein n=1 Tax=Hymenobacter sp. CA2-7 TaxID=3063993 RepID=UPI002712D431|nr:helix-turn-helix transcriptional regulator [Hymenobacter sp. CA2-7]MDO7886282.1 helix-turn-helix transcriptional regulator [Hymenobacter sp. CA2-7]
MKPDSLEEFYSKFKPGTAAGPGPAEAPDRAREIGHFNVFRVADLMVDYRHRPPMTFDRRAFYKISLIRGRSRVENADKVVDIARSGLWFATSRVPYRWLPQDLNQAGYFCIFTDGFLLPAKSGVVLEELPVFQPGTCPVLEVTDEEYAAIKLIFEKMFREINSDYAYKYDLLRTYLLELIHAGQKLLPAPGPALAHKAPARLTALFGELLERQFPLEMPQQRLRLRTAADYASALAVHVNHLNRVLKETTGRTTTALIGGRLAQEAKVLLKQTNWNISEIADSLGFTDVAHFCHFFKRQTGLAPGAFRE